jgi:hypothetical protein
MLRTELAGRNPGVRRPRDAIRRSRGAEAKGAAGARARAASIGPA